MPHATSPVRSLALCVMTAVTGAAADAPAPAPPLVAVDIAPAPVIAAHFQRSFLATVWNDPTVRPLHAMLQQGLERPDAAQVKALLDAMMTEQGMGMRLVRLLGTHDHPDAQVEGFADFGAAATAVFDALRAKAQEEAPEPLPAVTWTGADAALALPPEGPATTHVGRFGGILRLAHPMGDPPSWRPDAGDADLRIRLDVQGLLTQLLTWGPRDLAQDPIITQFVARFGPAESSITLVPAGVHTVGHATCPSDGLLPIDRAKLTQIPANAREVSAFGIDGAAAYQTWSPPLLALARHLLPAGAPDPLVKINAQLVDAGLPSLAALCASFHGTCLLIATPGGMSPVPGYTLVLPRSHGIDQLAQVLVARAGQTLPPVGTELSLPLGQVTAHLLRTDEELVFTTDVALSGHWPSSGWTDTALGNAMLARLDSDTVAVTSGDTPAEVKDLIASAGGMLGLLPIAPEQQQAIHALLERVGEHCKPAWTIASVHGGVVTTEGEGIGSISGLVAAGLVGSVVVPMVIAQKQVAAAGQARMDDPVHVLTTNVLPAEVQYQNGGYHDSDHSGIGEYGFFSEMSSAPAAEGLTLLPPDFHQAEPVIGHYHYRVFLPADDTSAEADAFPKLRVDVPAGAGLRKRCWVAYAWPEHPGAPMYAMNQSGTVFEAPFTGAPPAWNALYGGGAATWSSGQPTWAPARPGRRAHAHPPAHP